MTASEKVRSRPCVRLRIKPSSVESKLVLGPDGV